MRVDESFFGRVGHDFRGELATMLAGVHFLLRYESGFSPTARQMLERVNAAGQRLKRLLDESGAVAWALEGPRHLPSVRKVALRALITSALPPRHALAEGRRVAI